MNFLLATAAATGCLVCWAPAQQLIPVYPQFDDAQQQAATSGSFGALEPARVTGMGLDDLIFIRGGQAYLSTAPGLFSGAVPLDGLPTGQVRDVRAVPGFGSDGFDAVAVLGDFGVGLWTLDRTVPAASFLLVDNSWGSATDLQIGDLDGDGVPEAVAVDGGQVRIVSLARPHAPATRTPSDLIYAAIPFDYDPTLPGDELGIVSSTGIQVQAGTSTVVLHSVPMAFTAGRATRLVQPGVDLLVAAVETAESRPQSLLLTLSGDGLPLQTTDLYGQQVMSLSSGESTGDAFGDVALTFVGGGTFELLFNRSGVLDPRFEYSNLGGFQVALPYYAVPQPGDLVRPAMLDLEGDGDVDFVTAANMTDALTLAVSDWASGDWMRPQVEQFQTSPPPGPVSLTVHTPAVPGSTANHLEILSWQVRCVGGMPELVPTGCQRVLVPCSGTQAQTVAAQVDFSTPLTQPGILHEGYLCYARMVELDAAQRVVQAFPAWRFGYVEPTAVWAVTSGGDGGETGVVTPIVQGPPPPPPQFPAVTPGG